MGCTASGQQSENQSLCRCRCQEDGLAEGGETAARNGLLGVALDSSEPALCHVKSPLDAYEPPIESLCNGAGTGETKDVDGVTPWESWQAAEGISPETDLRNFITAEFGIAPTTSNMKAPDSDIVKGCQDTDGVTRQAAGSDFVKSSQPGEEFDIASATTATTLRDRDAETEGTCSESRTPPISPKSPGRAQRRTQTRRLTLQTDVSEQDLDCSEQDLDSLASPEDSQGIPMQSLGSITASTAMQVSKGMQSVIENHRAIDEIYTLKKELGKGASGSVREGVLKASGDRRAVKQVSKAQLKDRQGAINEINIMKMVDHLNVIALFETFEDHSHIFFVMPLCPHGHLKKRVLDAGHMNEEEATPCMRQIVAAIHYLHNNNIAHRDCKPENVLCHTVTPLNLKLSDFGLSRVIKPKRMMTTVVGSPTFMAPEVFTRKYNARCDIWSLGVSLFFLLSGKLPFDGETFEEVKAAVLKGKVAYGSKEWVDVKEDTIDFLSGMLKKIPRQRYSADEVFLHAWLKEEEKALAVKDPHRIFHDLQKFRKTNKLKRAALVVTASMLKTDDSVQHHSNFVALDPNNDGQVSLEEISSKLKPKTMSDASVASVFEDEYSEGGGFVPFSYTEFLAATMDKKKLITQKICKAAFAHFDKNSDGGISMAELAEGHLLGNLSMEELAATYADIDTNSDGNLTLEEFKKMLLA